MTALVAFIGWILLYGIDALSNAEKLPAAASKFVRKVGQWYVTDQYWTGTWTNEGDIDARFQPEIHVNMDLLVQRNRVQGTISTPLQLDSTPLQFVLLEGVTAKDGLEVLAFDYFAGTPKRIATFRLSMVEVNGEDQVQLMTTWQAVPWFPKQTRLWKAGASKLAEIAE